MTVKKANSGSQGAVERLASWALDIGTQDFPRKAIDRAKLLLLDTLGCGIAGHEDHAAHAALAAVTEIGGTAACSVIGRDMRTSLPNAVLINGFLIRALDLNDYVIDAKGAIGGHPSDNIPVALAAGEYANRSGRDVLAAIVLGYELYGRCKDMLERGSPWDGASLTGFVAPVMAGWLMKLDLQTLAHAISLSLARAATSAIVRTGEISAAKSLANALVAQSGVQACLLARAGLTGPLGVMEHRRGMQAVFSKFDAEALVRPMPADSYILQASIKTYPCVVTAQAAVAAAVELREAIGGIASIEHLRVVMPDTPTVHAHQSDPERANPQSRESADHSLHFVIAAALADGTFGLRQFDQQRWNDPSLRRLMGKMEMAVDAELTRRAPGSFACRLEARLTDGGIRQSEVLYAPGFSRDSLDASAVLAKFSALTPHLSASSRTRLIDAVEHLDQAQSVLELQRALAASAHSA